MRKTIFYVFMVLFLMLFSGAAFADDVEIISVEKCGGETKITVLSEQQPDSYIYIYKIDNVYKYVNHGCSSSGYCNSLGDAIKNACGCVSN